MELLDIIALVRDILLIIVLLFVLAGYLGAGLKLPGFSAPQLPVNVPQLQPPNALEDEPLDTPAKQFIAAERALKNDDKARALELLEDVEQHAKESGNARLLNTVRNAISAVKSGNAADTTRYLNDLSSQLTGE